MAGEVLYWLPQIPFCLPGGIKYYADFLVVWQRDDDWGKWEELSFEDVKGRVITRESKMKIKMIEDIYGIKIRIV
jgi:hypothetical protein